MSEGGGGRGYTLRARRSDARGDLVILAGGTARHGPALRVAREAGRIFIPTAGDAMMGSQRA
ncbi:hypothetical protein [Ornithinimicrobium pratense]|uniref:Uncharacterized protein n=1 Tax=Ornithinimicrobium pratense TaxID=2593973 RepID=A0A5J6V8F0_9MICO|nr:hypothetical protein [Ornithinimicrobium pratense]QFG69431.1 hypothetical protein FY030_12600 [Ornithinimicrobium pratense]